MRRKRIAFSTLTIFVGFLGWTPTAQAQQVSVSRHWIVEAGPRLVQISSEGIHINQPDPKGLTYYGIVSTHIALPAGKPWKIDFDLKFGQLRSAGVGIGLFNGPDLMGWVGADGWYKQMGCFVGKSNEVAAPQANIDWHKFEFSGDGITITIKKDGNVLGSGSQLGMPNTIRIGDINGSVQPAGAEPTKMLNGQQSEITVQNVRFQSLPKVDDAIVLLPGVRPLSSSINAQQAQDHTLIATNPDEDKSIASFQNTLDWITRTINHSATRQETSTIDRAVHEENYSDAHAKGTQLSFTWESIDPASLEHNINKITVDLDKLEANKIEVVEDKGIWDEKIHYKVMLVGKEGTQSVKREVVTGSRLLGGLRGGTSINFTDADIAKRFVKAIKHAIQLCASKPSSEPF